MTTADAQSSSQTTRPFRLPDPPEREWDALTSFDYVYEPGSPLHLNRHFGRPESTLVKAEKWIVPYLGHPSYRVPDLMIAFDVDPGLYDDQNGYVISDQGKPPDFVLEVASRSTATIDIIDKRRDYAEFAIREYWRFDHTGELHGARLAGDRLVDDRYEPIPLEELSADVIQGHSEALDLILRWDHGQLAWIDPETDEHIPTFDGEREGRLAAEARVRELEAELRRLRD